MNRIWKIFLEIKKICLKSSQKKGNRDEDQEDYVKDCEKQKKKRAKSVNKTKKTMKKMKVNK